MRIQLLETISEKAKKGDIYIRALWGIPEYYSKNKKENENNWFWKENTKKEENNFIRFDWNIQFKELK